MPWLGVKVDKRPTLFIDSLDVFKPAYMKTFSFEVENMDLVKEPIQNGSISHLIVSKDVGPFFDRTFASHDGAAQI